MNEEFSSEELTASRRQRGEAALSAASEERISGVSPVVSYFDWETPALSTPHLLTFLARVRTQRGTNVRFASQSI
jgi:hypothetical protein